MDRPDVLRAIVTTIGAAIFREAPEIAADPWRHLDDLREIAGSLSRWQGVYGTLRPNEARRLCDTFVRRLEEPRLPRGAAALAVILEHLSSSLDKRTRRRLWLRLAQNRRVFIRRRYMRLLQDGLTQREADVLWQLHCELGDVASVWTLAMADASIHVPAELLDEVEQLFGPPFLLSHAIAHRLRELGPPALQPLRQRFSVPALYGVGYSGRADFAPLLVTAITDDRLTDDERRGALWSLARIGRPDDVLGALGPFIHEGV